MVVSLWWFPFWRGEEVCSARLRNFQRIASGHIGSSALEKVKEESDLGRDDYIKHDTYDNDNIHII
jgi:hypothetical protein